MELAQAANAIPDTNSVSTALGITPTEFFWAIAIISIMVVGFWAIVKYNSSDISNRYRDQKGFTGSKGGEAKTTISDADNAND